MLDLKPKPVWKYFEEISKIPRCSKDEERVGEYIKNVAKENGLSFRQDEAGNIVVRKPGTKDAKGPITVLQSHTDMVCEKDEGVDHDFSNDPIVIEKIGDWLTAKGTTLGADNGIGVAISLAIAASDEIKHGPLEFLFTVDEETGLNGASNLEKGILEGRRLVNLDSEEFGKITIGCAGGGKSIISLPIKTKTRTVEELSRIRILGLKGGHSGLDIDKGRANSIKILGRLLWKIFQWADGQILIHKISGGNKDNAIPRDSKALLYFEGSTDDIERMAMRQFKKISEEYQRKDPNIEVDFGVQGGGDAIELMTQDSSRRVVDALQALPHGVLEMSQRIQGLVKTSTNLASVAGKNNGLVIRMVTRSSSLSKLEGVRGQIRTIAEMAGANVEENKPYPGWEPDTDSELLTVFEDTFEELFGREPETKAIHAGIETGILGNKFKGMDMVSVGPELKNPHSPEERVNIHSVRRLWQYLIEALDRLAV